jgi:acyl-CoA thioester hydrolase
MTASLFRHAHRVTYADCTIGNHIYYARYLDLIEAARGEFFRHVGVTFLEWQEQDVIFPVVECRLRYRNPARYDDVLTTEIWITLAEGVRLNFAYRMLNQSGALVLEGETFHVAAGMNEKPKRLPEGLLPKLKPYVGLGEKPG